MGQLLAPLERFRSAGGARIDLPGPAAHYSPRMAGLEGFARPLWALAAAAKGGAEMDYEPWLRGLAAGCNPDHPEFWGVSEGPNQRTVEAAAIGFAIGVAPQVFWDPLPSAAKKNLAWWLNVCGRAKIFDSNWHFFPVLINLGLRRVGAAPTGETVESHLAAIDNRFTGAGWYRDFADHFDYYNGFAFHFYGLAYSILMAEEDPAGAAKFRERAALFAQDYQYWFGADGAAVPFGRSLIYRFAHAAFWGMLAAANVEAMPWPRIKALFLRNLNWWFARPILDASGVLTLGYAYPSLFVSEEYNSPASPYWALKSMIGLAAGPTHPFWQAEPEDPRDLPDGVRANFVTGVVLSRSAGQVTLLNAGQKSKPLRQGSAKYGKFAYSSVFGFSTESSSGTLEQLAPDNTLVLWRQDRGFKTREAAEVFFVGTDWIWSRWEPWTDTVVETWLLARGAYHLRAHLITCPEPFTSIEGGFAIPIPDDVDVVEPAEGEFAKGIARITLKDSESGVADLKSQRMGHLLTPSPNTNVHHLRTVLPILHARHNAGTAFLTARVWAQSPTGPGMADNTADIGNTMDLPADAAALDEIVRQSRDGKQPS